MNIKQMPVMIVMMVLMIAGIVFVVQGVNMHNDVDTLEASFHASQEDYLVNNTKAERDSAPANSDLNKQLADLANTPSELLRLKLVGVGKMLTGIFIVLFGIMIALVMMPVRLGQIIKDKDQPANQKV